MIWSVLLSNESLSHTACSATVVRYFYFRSWGRRFVGFMRDNGDYRYEHNEQNCYYNNLYHAVLYEITNCFTYIVLNVRLYISLFFYRFDIFYGNHHARVVDISEIRVENGAEGDECR